TAPCPLSLHDALPISPSPKRGGGSKARPTSWQLVATSLHYSPAPSRRRRRAPVPAADRRRPRPRSGRRVGRRPPPLSERHRPRRSEEHTSELQSLAYL